MGKNKDKVFHKEKQQVDKTVKNDKEEKIQKSAPIRNDKKENVKSNFENKKKQKENKVNEKPKSKSKEIKEMNIDDEISEIDDLEVDYNSNKKLRKLSTTSNKSKQSTENKEVSEENVKEIFITKLKQVETQKNTLFPETQVKQAINCLKTLLEKSESVDIFSRKEEEMLQINYTFGKLPLKYSLRPINIPCKQKSQTVKKVCLIIKDKFKDNWLNLDLKDFEKESFELDAITYSDLKNEYSQFEQKRNLAKRYDIFLCDKTLYFMLKRVLGKVFYNSKKYPLALPLTKGKIMRDVEDVEEEEKELSTPEKQQIKNMIIEAVTNPIFTMGNGPNYTVKAGYLATKTETLVEEVKKVGVYALAHILKWGVDVDDVKSITLKFSTSLELPIFNQLSKEEIDAYYSKISENKKAKEKDGKEDKKQNKQKKR